MFPVVLLLIFATVFGGTDGRRRRRDRDDDLLRAGDHHPLGDLGDDAEPGDVAGDRPRGRPPQARPRHADAGLGLHRRPGRQLDRRRAADAGAARGDRRASSTASPIPWERLPAILRHAGGRRRLLLLPRHRPDRGDPLPGRRRADRQRAAAAALLPLRHLHPRRRAPRAASSTSPTTSRSATSSRPSSTPTCPAAAPAIAWDNLAVVAIWGVAGLLLAIRFFRWTPRSRLSGRRPTCRGAPPYSLPRSMLHHVLLEVSDLDRSAAFYDSMLAPLGWRRHFEEDETIGWGIAKPVFFVAAHHDPKPGFGLLSFSGARDRRRQGGLGGRRSKPAASASASPASGARTAPAPTRLSSRTRTGTRSRSPSGPTESTPTP